MLPRNRRESMLETCRMMLLTGSIGTLRTGMLAAVLATAVAGLGAPATLAQGTTPEAKPYDDRLLRLSEVLGAVHYLRELCGANDGQIWRERMQDLMNAEGSSALRRARLTRSFNQGYRSYSRTYAACSPSAQTAVGRFVTEAAQLTDGLLKVP